MATIQVSKERHGHHPGKLRDTALIQVISRLIKRHGKHTGKERDMAIILVNKETWPPSR
jgi:hypothetical protein